MGTLTHERLTELLDYDPSSGRFIWKQSSNPKQKVGHTAGYLSHGYRIIMIEGKNYRGARLAFLYMTGEFPPNQVDHINGKRDDDSWCNLRLATNGENNQNKPSKNYCKIHNGTYLVYIDVNGQRIYLGTFKTESSAKEAANSAKEKYHGRFANFLEQW